MFNQSTVPALLAGLLATTALSAPAFAQTTEVDEIVVTGQREAQRAAIAVKREAFVVADVVSADDIGKLPDHNTAAALRRIPGISVMEDQGEPRFPVVREVTTSSWLGRPHQGQGLGTEARTGALALAFDHLGAEAARTEVFPDNHASQGVSRRLGYQPDGISRDARGDEVLVSDRLRLTRSTWQAGGPRGVEVLGLEPARHLLGV